MSAPTPYYDDGQARLYHGDCLALMRALPSASVDAVVTDPPYPEIDRDYGRWTEAEWHSLMRDVVSEVRRLLTPTGSAVFVLQPNSERVGRMRLWLWEFMVWAGREWGIVQDAWWWNVAAMPSAGATSHGLLRGALKACVWLGPPHCYRNQDAVLWRESESNAALRAATRVVDAMPGRVQHPSGHSVNHRAIAAAAERRGGVTPFNVLPLPNTDSQSSGGAVDHGAATPLELCKWWVRYLCPPVGTVLDPFCGSGTVLRAAKEQGRYSIGIEQLERYCALVPRNLGQQFLPLELTA